MQHHRGPVRLGQPVQLGDQRTVAPIGIVLDHLLRRRGRTPRRQLLDATAPPRRIRRGTHGDPPRDAEQPVADRIAAADGRGLADQQEERRLEGVGRIVRIAQDPPADAQDHRPVPLQQRREGRLGFRRVVPAEEPRQERTVAEVTDRTHAVEHPELTGQDAAGSFTIHRENPFEPRNPVSVPS